MLRRSTDNTSLAAGCHGRGTGASLSQLLPSHCAGHTGRDSVKGAQEDTYGAFVMTKPGDSLGLVRTNLSSSSSLHGIRHTGLASKDLF